MNKEFQTVVTYMKAHWPSQVKPEWQVSVEEYAELSQKAVELWTKNATKNHELVRIAGVSGSGKTTQLLPAVEAFFKSRGQQPILVAARCFVDFHPHLQEIEKTYGTENLRKMTDEFATIMLFITFHELASRGYDMILDVTMLDPQIEGILVSFLRQFKYTSWLTMVAIAPEISQKFLGKRNWRHSKETEAEFIRATDLALDFYRSAIPDMRFVIWNAWGAKPVYDGPIKDSREIWRKYSTTKTYRTKLTEDDLREAKIRYLSKLPN